MKHLLLLILTIGFTMNTFAKDDTTRTSPKAAIVLVAFGSTSPKTIKTYNEIEQSFKKAFPENAISWAYTSDIVRKKLREKGIQINDLVSEVDKRLKDGYKSIVLQSLHIMPGEEYLSIKVTDTTAKFIIGEPLLSSPDDLKKVAEVLLSLCSKDNPTVIAAHGNGNDPALNKPLLELATIITSKTSTAVLCTIEGKPGIEPFEKISTLAKKQNSVHFIPFLLVSGVHVEKDLIGSDSSSWKSKLGVANVTISPSMGQLPAIHDIYIEHCKNALLQLVTKK